MNFSIVNGLPFTSIEVCFRGQELKLNHVLIDTGSAGTILKADLLRQIGVTPEVDDYICATRGVGGSEVVFFKTIDFLQIGNIRLSSFEIEVGEMNYGFSIDGILGFDFMRSVGLVIYTDRLQITHTSDNPPISSSDSQ